MSYTTIRFREVKLYGNKTGKCGCGKRRVRRQKFYQTISPFNLDKKTGQPKSEATILEELRERVAAWQDEPITCDKCKVKP
jgi:hypothetical protein